MYPGRSVGVAAIWAVAGLDHTIDVSKVVLWLFHSCHDYFLSPLPCISPSCFFYAGDIFSLRRMPFFFQRRVNGGSGTIWSQVICLWNRLDMKKRLL